MPPRSNRVFWSGFALSAAAAILFSTKAIWVKLAFVQTKIDPVSLLALRMLFALPFYLLVAVWQNKKSSPLSTKDLLGILLMGCAGYYLSSLFDFIGLQYISAGLERLILFLYPSLAVLINTLLFKTKLYRHQIWALVLTYCGIGLAYWGEWQSVQEDAGFFWGSFMVFCCAITYSFYLVGSGHWIPKAGSLRYTAYAMLAATLGIFVHYGISQPTLPQVMENKIWQYGILLALLATVLPSFLMSMGMKRIGSNNTSIITSIGPVSTILQAHFFLGESITLSQIAGTVLVLMGVAVMGRSPAASGKSLVG
ncbi:MAG: DMT family transporter [Sphingobacteriia bacterium]|nr:MAG: DMT family transporter [Sphingobacteriia bacterium]